MCYREIGWICGGGETKSILQFLGHFFENFFRLGGMLPTIMLGVTTGHNPFIGGAFLIIFFGSCFWNFLELF